MNYNNYNLTTDYKDFFYKLGDISRLDHWRRHQKRNLDKAEKALEVQSTPELEKVEKPEGLNAEVSSQNNDDVNYLLEFLLPQDAVEVEQTEEDKVEGLNRDTGQDDERLPLSYSRALNYAKAADRDRVVAGLKRLAEGQDIPDDVLEALAMLIGAESGYQADIQEKSGTSSAHGYGQLIASNLLKELRNLGIDISNNVDKDLKSTDKKKKESAVTYIKGLYNNLSDDEKLKIVFNHYYNSNKEKLQNADLAEAFNIFNLYGFSPRLASGQSVTINGKTYSPDESGYAEYYFDFHPNVKSLLARSLQKQEDALTWQDILNMRASHAGYDVN